MPKWLWIAPCLAGLATAQSPSNGPTRFVDLVFTGDSHSHLLPSGPRDAALEAHRGGFARVARYVATIDQRDQPAVFVHTGDFSIGDPLFSRFLAGPELGLLAATEFDVVTCGNHEWDLGPTTLLWTLANTFPTTPAFPLVTCNVDLSAMPALMTYFADDRIVAAGDLRIGIFGITTPDTNWISNPAPVQFDPEVVAHATAAARSLRMQGCDIVVMASHLGLYLDWIVAENVPGIDVILGGHDHLLFTQPITLDGPTGPVVYAHAGEFYGFVGRMRLRKDRNGISLQRYELVPLDARHKEDRAIRAQIDGLAAIVEQTWPGMYTHVVTTADRVWGERVLEPLALGFHDTDVGNLVADAFRWRGGTDLAVQPSGQTAGVIEPGPVLPVDLFHVNGYGFNATDGLGFELERFQTLGAVLWGGFEYALGTLELSDDLLIQVSDNVRYGYDPTAPLGARLQWILIDGVPIDPNAWYSVTANSAVLAFLTGLAPPGTVIPLGAVGATEFAALTSYVESHGLVLQGPTGRVLAFTPTP